MGMMLLLLGWNNSLAQNGKLIFTPHWIPQAQFAGYYVAVDQGFYKDNGLDVDIVHSTANIASLDLLKNGDADIVSSFMLDAIEQRANGVPLVNIGQLSQHSSLMIVTKRNLEQRFRRCTSCFYAGARYQDGSYQDIANSKPLSYGRGRCAIGHVLQRI
jgi:ABC-type nitrate/sulfonate/bicarbonate transport system substrate-binding protein